MYFSLFNTMTRHYLSSIQMMMAAGETIVHRSTLHQQGSVGQIPYPHAEMTGMFLEKAENFWTTGMIAMFELQGIAARNMRSSAHTIPAVLSTLNSMERIAAPTRRIILANARRLRKKK